MLNRIVYSLGIRMIMILGLVLFGGIASLFSHPDADAKAKSASPWSKSHTASTSSKSNSGWATSDRATSETGWVDKRTGRPATEEQIQDEAYRRQVLREMREDYERKNGPVDTSAMDSAD